MLVGEADGCWLWLLLWPGEADILLAEHLLLRDARREPVDPQIGAAGLRLVPLTSR